MNNRKSVKILKMLIANHNDRIASYEIGLHELEEPELKSMFSRFILVSQKFKEDLSKEVRKEGGVPPEGAREGSNFLVAWQEVKKALKKMELEEIRVACEQCEKVMVNAYDKVLTDYEEEISTLQQLTMIEAQQKMLKANLKEIIDFKSILTHPK